MGTARGRKTINMASVVCRKLVAELRPGSIGVAEVLLFGTTRHLRSICPFYAATRRWFTQIAWPKLFGII